MQMPIHIAAEDLKKYLFGRGYNVDDPGYLAISSDRIFVTMKGAEKTWLGKKPTEWLGYPVEWSWDNGEIVALRARP